MKYPQLWRSPALSICLLFTALASAPSANAASHAVRKGETFTSIARQHGISLSTLKNLNPKVNPHRIFEGQVLNTPDKAAETAASRKSSHSRGSSAKDGKSNFAHERGLMGSVKAPAPPPKASSPVRDQGSKAISHYKVKKGDTLTSVADRSGITVKQLMAMNKLSNSNLSINQTLLVSVPGGLPPRRTKLKDRNAIDISPPPPRSSGPSTPKAVTPSKPKKADEPAGSYYHIVKRKEDFSSIAAKHGVTWGDLARANKGVKPETIRADQRLVVPGKSSLASNRHSSQKSSDNSPSAPAARTEKIAARPSGRETASRDVRPADSPVMTPAPLPPVETPDSPTESNAVRTVYKVSGDDKIENIAKEFGTTPNDLRRLNDWGSFDQPIPNQFMYVPWSAPGMED